MESYLGARGALSCGTGVTSNSQTSSKWYANIAWTAECFCLHVAWHTASSCSVVAPEKAHLGTLRLRAIFTHPRQATFSVECLGVLFVLLPCFFPQKVWSLSPVVFWYISCSLPKHAGCMTNEVGVELAKIISLFLSPVAISILVPQTLPNLRPRGIF